MPTSRPFGTRRRPEEQPLLETLGSELRAQPMPASGPEKRSCFGPQQTPGSFKNRHGTPSPPARGPAPRLRPGAGPRRWWNTPLDAKAASNGGPYPNCPLRGQSAPPPPRLSQKLGEGELGLGLTRLPSPSFWERGRG